jgi:2-keto-4-pentenoate hydratase
MSKLRFEQAAKLLFDAHERREPFRPLPAALAPHTAEAAYAIQDAFVALRSQKRGAIAGYKIALSSAQMRRFVGVDEPQAGMIFESTVQRTPAAVRAADYLRLIVEFEIAVQMAEDLPAADAPFLLERVAKAVGSVMPALELADDRNADYAELSKHPLELIADNTWNEGAVLGYPLAEWRSLDLAAARGRASINGKPVGEGVGGDAMGHPFNAVAWIADHLAAHGRGLLRGDVVITGSIITTKNVSPGDLVMFSVDGLGDVELRVD